VPMGKLYIGKNSTSFQCPKTNVQDECKKCSRGLCWNKDICQKFDVQPKKNPCHPLCLGGCTDATPEGCFVCRDIMEDLKCVESCSQGRFLNGDSRRCITADECKNMNRKIYKKDCLKECPAGYETDFDENLREMGTCKPCINKCPRVCSNVPEIRTIGQLEAIGIGCTVINGSLEIVNFNHFN
jgi:hypothetical protein